MNLTSRINRIEKIIKESNYGKKVKTLEYVIHGDKCPEDKRYRIHTPSKIKLEDIILKQNRTTS